jgi:molybdenum cofactor guanylyltransferase
MDRSAIILAGGSSSRFGEDKGAALLNGKPLLAHVVDAVKGVAEEVIVVTSTKERTDAYAKLVSPKVKFAIDVCESKGALVGALSGFEAAEGKYSLLLPFDNPFVSKDVVTLLFECAIGKAAAIPRWTSTEVEPLYAVYNTDLALQAAKEALAQDELDMKVMISKLRGVRYISTLVIEQIDPDLRTFFNVNTPVDLKNATAMSKTKPSKTKKR